MCGIAGIVHFGGVSDAPRRARLMADAIRHRGPDGEGFWNDQDVAFGFRRLAIVDLDGGAQPMGNEDGSIWVVFNGEIYNHRELRAELEAAGHLFASDHSDTEVLVHGWEKWGERLPQHLNGMFAFAVWDQRARRLFLARDRYGIKPLYLAAAPGGIVFASEVRALHASGLVSVEPDPAAVLQYFSLMNFWHGQTPFRGITMLPPGTCETITPEAPPGRQHRYWDFAFLRNRCGGTRESEAAAFRELLQDALRRQLIADVPVMTYLSGGIDSTAITAASCRLDSGVHAYSCIFDLDGVGEDRFVDEREFSRAVAETLAIDRVELEIPPDALIHTLDATVQALEYPRMGMAYVNYLIARRVAANAKVVLSGMGGDEMTGGYVGRYALVRRTPARSLARDGDPFSVYRAMLNVPIPAAELPQAFTPEFLAAAGGFSPLAMIHDAITSAPSEDPWDVLMYVDATTYLHGLLVLEDKLSMVHSLETRVPLLDNAIVDHLLRTPWPLLSDGKTGKILFRDAVRPWVPEAVYQKPKMGFGPPDASWYRGRLRGWVAERLDSLAERGVLRPDYIRGKFSQHLSGEANWVALIWCFLSFESWCRQAGVFGGTAPAGGAVRRAMAGLP
jgi:asparagine synthase (glutamine-hydrolysing)